MSLHHDERRGFAGPALWTLAFVLTLGTVRQVAAGDDAAKAEAQRLTLVLQKAEEQNAALRAENQKLRADLKDEQLKNAIDVDQEVKRLRDLLRTAPTNEDALAAYARQVQSDIDRRLAKKIAEIRANPDQVNKLVEVIESLQRELAQPKPTPPEAPTPAPKVEPPPVEGPTPEQLRRLTDELRRRAEAERDQAEQARREVQQARELAEQARREAEEREKQARAAAVAPKADAARLELEIRAARLEAQIQVWQMAHSDLRKEANRLREELDTERKTRHDQSSSRPSSATDDTHKRLDKLEALVGKLTTVLEVLEKKVESIVQKK